MHLSSEDIASPTLATLARYGVEKATVSLMNPPLRLKSHIAKLDHLLQGGLPFGTMTEWGLPFGQGGRELLLRYLISATHGRGLKAPLLCLWAYSPSSRLHVYPPAWSARGVLLKNLRFAVVSRPAVQLKPAFLRPLFKVVILDAPDTFTKEDAAFVAREAHKNQQLVLLLRNTPLTPERGNVWAKIRLNCWQDETTRCFWIKTVRGLAPAEHRIEATKDPEGEEESA